MKQSKVIPVAVVRKHYEDFQERISGYESRTERKALTGYLLYSMLVASGRHGEIFTDGTVTDDPPIHLLRHGKIDSEAEPRSFDTTSR